MSKDKNNSDVIFEQNYALRAKGSNLAGVDKMKAVHKSKDAKQKKEGDEK